MFLSEGYLFTVCTYSTVVYASCINTNHKLYINNPPPNQRKYQVLLRGCYVYYVIFVENVLTVPYVLIFIASSLPGVRMVHYTTNHQHPQSLFLLLNDASFLQTQHILFVSLYLTRSGLEPMIYHTWGKHANHYTTLWFSINLVCFLIAGLLTKT
jgi:hypothetical protein